MLSGAGTPMSTRHSTRRAEERAGDPAAKSVKRKEAALLSFLRDFSDRSAPSGEEADKRKQTHVVVLRCAVCTLFEFLEQ